MKECARHSCHLTALWQVGLTFTPRWDSDLPPVRAWTSMCLCGMCIDDLKVEDFGDMPERMAASMTEGHPDSVVIEIRREDISDGYWRDPGHPEGRVPQ